MRRAVTLRGAKVAVLALVLGVCAFVAPDSSTHPTDFELIKVEQAQSVDLSPDVTWIMAVGSDARPGEDMTHTRGDALQLIGIDSRTGAATAIGIPRDSYVDIDGVGSDKINASLYYGGPQLLATTVGQLVGIQPDYVFVTRFEKFEAMVEQIGGVYVDNPTAFSDTYIKPKGFRTGRIHLGPYDALAFARIRHDLLRGDFDRSANQQRVLRGIAENLHTHAGEPGFLERGVTSAITNMATNASPAELYRLARAAASIKPGKVTSCVLQGDIGDVGGASVVLPYTDQAQRLGDRARDDATLESCE